MILIKNKKVIVQSSKVSQSFLLFRYFNQKKMSVV